MERVNAYVASIFQDFKNTEEIAEQKEELTTNLIARIEDLTKEGYDEPTAIEIAIDSAGDFDELVSEIKNEQNHSRKNVVQEKPSYLVHEATLNLHTAFIASLFGLLGIALSKTLLSIFHPQRWLAYYRVMVDRQFWFTYYRGIALAIGLTLILLSFFVYNWHKKRTQVTKVQDNFLRNLLVFTSFAIILAGSIGFFALGSYEQGWDAGDQVLFACWSIFFLISWPLARTRILKQGLFQADRNDHA